MEHIKYCTSSTAGSSPVRIRLHTCSRLRSCTRLLNYSSKPVRERLCVARAEKRDERDRGDSPEKLFQRELQKRGISGSGAEQSNQPTEKASTSQTEAPFDAEKLRSQLEESRKLNSEGLEGLIPRAKQLITLGVTFFLAFAPVVLAISLLFSGIFWLYGDNFIHGGRPTFTPYVDPAELLNEPTVDPRIPY